jgi:hypothetical protein
MISILVQMLTGTDLTPLLKQGISFWRYLKDRVFQKFSIPYLSDLIQQNAEKQVAGSI